LQKYFKNHNIGPHLPKFIWPIRTN
jgi:hypothetical protein